MFKQTLLGLLCVALGYIGGMQAVSHSQGLRLEAGYGGCEYGKGQDGQWRKDGYPTFLELKQKCWNVGVSQMPFTTPGGRLGWRASYIDFGNARADALAPMRDDEANSFPTGNNCDTNTWSGCLGYFSQSGRAKGFSIGPVLEKTTDLGTVGIEAGLYHYRSNWHVTALLPYAPCNGCAPQQAWDWNGAAGTHTTYYVGFTFEHSGFFAQVRLYKAIYASADLDKNPLNIGLISGPLKSVMVGYQWAL